MASKRYEVTVAVGGKTVTYTTEAKSGEVENLGNGLVKIGEVTVREGALLSVAPVQDGKQESK